MSTGETNRECGDESDTGQSDDDRQVTPVSGPRMLLRAEGLAVFAASVGAYYALGGPLWLFVVLALAPDVSMVGYLAGARIGSATYNAFHTLVAPVVLAAVGLWHAAPFLVWVALLWAAHIGMDRVVGYGLKYPTEFSDTHLSRLRNVDDGVSSPDIETTLH
ncbi:DUF4260 family protein [Haloferax sp. MBLA0076]|uniref:DUF4260 family protein n=1 Tax=Haloferax litoreum TaxID=2666140 RepID=A0A6A8GGN2_9EURY|nr:MULTISPECIES: DUF4260 domain-containing protein [Haloferax]KAB1193788.1 DUF4260 domain-containing protein [Haloferax sp. CBA1148]MRX22325.1 DUF4260 family protein [Haloferax litoreum]